MARLRSDQRAALCAPARPTTLGPDYGIPQTASTHGEVAKHRSSEQAQTRRDDPSGLSSPSSVEGERGQVTTGSRVEEPEAE